MEFEITNKISTKSLSISDVPVINKQTTYDEFFKRYMHPNLPCIIQNVTEDWEANSNWIRNGVINLEYMKNRYAACDVTVYNCRQKYYNSHHTDTVKFSRFVDSWESANSNYLKDWHLKNTFKDDDFYQVPIYFASDWLNEFLTANSEDDYRFVYMGRAGTWTPFHSDVFNSFSWSANVCGRKKWVLFPPGEENGLRDSLNNLPFDIGDIYSDKRHFEVIQEAGDAVFVPSGWYHQVWNLEDTISINHNWVSGCNIMKMWTSVADNLRSVKKELEDCQDMDEFARQCQVVLNASFGMDFSKFYDFLEFVALKRLKQLSRNECERMFHGHLLGVNHARFDLKAVTEVLENFTTHVDVGELFTEKKSPRNLLKIINHAKLNDYVY